MTVAQGIERYVVTELRRKAVSTQRKQAHQLAFWTQRIGHYPINNVPRTAIAKARDALLESNTYRHKRRSGSTVNRYLAALSHFFTVAIKDWGACTVNPVAQVRKAREGKHRLRYLRADERKRLMAECVRSNRNYLAALVETAIATGMRAGELSSLRWEHIETDLATNIGGEVVTCVRFYVPRSKNGKPRTVLCPARHLPRLLARAQGRGEVFPGNWQSAWQCALQRAGLEDFRFHDLRRTCGAYLAMSGASPREIADYLGHGIAMAMVYQPLSPNHGAAVAHKAAGYF